MARDQGGRGPMTDEVFELDGPNGTLGIRAGIVSE